jgi:hypothetical protein
LVGCAVVEIALAFKRAHAAPLANRGFESGNLASWGSRTDSTLLPCGTNGVVVPFTFTNISPPPGVGQLTVSAFGDINNNLETVEVYV